MQYPSYVFAETLRDGTAVTVRAAGANDGPKIRRAFLNLERDTVYTRFFGYKADVSDAELGRITGADFERAVALLVTIGAGEDEVVIGGASYFVSAGRSAARTRCCCGRNLRSTQVRRAFRDAVDHSQAKMPQFDAYKAISLRIREIFAAYTPIIEPLSLDEGYLVGALRAMRAQAEFLRLHR